MALADPTGLNRRLGGLLLFLGAAQIVLALVVAESIYPGYSVSGNEISDLGVGVAAPVFNASVIALGVALIIGAWFFHLAYLRIWITLFIVLAGIGAIGVGVFPETTGAIHGVAAAIAFVFGALAAIASFLVLTSPLRYVSVALGILALIATALFATGTYLGLGPGGMERLIAYPEFVWTVAFGGYLMSARPLAP